METYDVLVIGSGALGSSVAFHLTRAGKRVALVDKAGIGSQTSARAAGLTGQLRRTDVMVHLARRSVHKLERFLEETGEPLVFYQPGSLYVARTEDHGTLVKNSVARGKSIGLDIELISLEEAHQLQPYLQPIGIRAVSHLRSDVYFEPAQIARGYAAAASKRGAALMPETRVDGFMMSSGRVGGVVTNRGELAARVVVDAAGGWVRRVAEMARTRAPVFPVLHQLLITVPLAGVSYTQPTVRILDVNVYVRPSQGGLMFGGYERNPRFVDTRQLSADFRVEDLQLDVSVLRRLAESAHAQFPILRDVALQDHRGGLPTMTPDGEHVVGPAPGIEGLYILGGCNVSGLSISPALGEELANWIVDGRPTVDLSRMSPSRFAEYLSEEELVRGATHRYANYYTPSIPVPIIH
jgi:glycine/D-amino acid oxidase-like deaminating enzyme